MYPYCSGYDKKEAAWEVKETKNPLSRRIQKILINKSYHNATDTKVISLFLFFSEVAVFFSDYFTAEQIVRDVG